MAGETQRHSSDKSDCPMASAETDIDAETPGQSRPVKLVVIGALLGAVGFNL